MVEVLEHHLALVMIQRHDSLYQSLLFRNFFLPGLDDMLQEFKLPLIPCLLILFLSFFTTLDQLSKQSLLPSAWQPSPFKELYVNPSLSKLFDLHCFHMVLINRYQSFCVQLIAVEMHSHFFISAFISFNLGIFAPHVGNEPHPKLPFDFSPFIDQRMISL